MIKNITVEEMVKALRKEHIMWCEDAIIEEAKNFLDNWDERLQDVVEEYVKNGKMTDFKYKEFSIMGIRSIRNCCGFLYAVELMDGYIKDNINGRIMIIRR